MCHYIPYFCLACSFLGICAREGPVKVAWNDGWREKGVYVLVCWKLLCHFGSQVWFWIPVLLTLLESPSFFIRSTSTSWPVMLWKVTVVALGLAVWFSSELLEHQQQLVMTCPPCIFLSFCTIQETWRSSVAESKFLLHFVLSHSRAVVHNLYVSLWQICTVFTSFCDLKIHQTLSSLYRSYRVSRAQAWHG